jgi:hypothetical protein
LVIRGERWSSYPKDGIEVVSTIKIVEVTNEMTHILLLNAGVDGKVRTIQAARPWGDGTLLRVRQRELRGSGVAGGTFRPRFCPSVGRGMSDGPPAPGGTCRKWLPRPGQRALDLAHLPFVYFAPARGLRLIRDVFAKQGIEWKAHIVLSACGSTPRAGESSESIPQFAAQELLGVRRADTQRAM